MITFILNKRSFAATLGVLLMSVQASVAQKLSAEGEMRIMQYERRGAFRTPASMTAARVDVFLHVANPTVLDSVRALGGEIRAEVSPGRMTASIPLHALRDVAALRGIDYVQAASDVHLCLDNARADASVDACHALTATDGTPYTGHGVIVGIVDNGFEYGHVDFYDTEGRQSRILRVWDQNGEGRSAPSGFSYGAEYTSAEDILSARYDKNTLYHGTHVAGIAAGADRRTAYYGVAPGADIVLVSYKNSSASVVDAVKYIFNYADQLGRPCVVNLSLSSNNGPHDGTSDTDVAFDAMTGPGRIVVGAAGNEGRRRIHVSKALTSSNPSLQAMVDFSSASSQIAYADVWGGAGQTVRVKAVAVDATTGQIVAQTSAASSSAPSYESMRLYKSGQVEADVMMSSETSRGNGCPHVSWGVAAQMLASNLKIGLVIEGEDGETVHAWLTDTESAFASTAVSGWTAGDYDCTVGEIGGTGRGVISVGSYITRNAWTTLDGLSHSYSTYQIGTLGGLALSSSHGPTADGRRKPDVAAPGCVIISAESKYSAGSDTPISGSDAVARTDVGGESYYYQALQGTSMAAPFVTGAVALWLQANPRLTPDDVRSILSATARRDAFTGDVADDDNLWGAGKVDVLAGLRRAEQLTGITDVTVLPLHGEKTVFDLSGRRVSHMQPGHIYIRGGRKVLFSSK